MFALPGCTELWRDCSHFLYGGAPGVARELAASLRRNFPEAQIVGTYTPPFRTLDHTEASELQQTIDRLRPDIVWVGLSTPKQEKFMAKYLLHRLLQEPRRLWKRYLLNNPAFLVNAFLQLTSIRHFDLNDESRVSHNVITLQKQNRG
jgi:N-acetylglucosaminyldiphosphoundecaprenol N-acetyl-beta-D-mannosaminyltransferase